jgi:hypothetical protein
MRQILFESYQSYQWLSIKGWFTHMVKNSPVSKSDAIFSLNFGGKQFYAHIKTIVVPLQ